MDGYLIALQVELLIMLILHTAMLPGGKLERCLTKQTGSYGKSLQITVGIPAIIIFITIVLYIIN